MSKFLSLLLRHRPEEIGLRLEAGGWASLEALVRGARREASAPLTEERIRALVREQDTPRFALSEDGGRIRANYGHSVDVELDLEPQAPPERLFHGTARRSVERILREGLRPRVRRFVHLSGDRESARRVGRRHGAPAILRIRAREMAGEGHAFYRAADGIWLVAPVPPEFLGPDRP